MTFSIFCKIFVLRSEGLPLMHGHTDARTHKTPGHDITVELKLRKKREKRK